MINLCTPSLTVGFHRTANGTNIWNALDYPAAVVPVTRVNAKEDPKAAPHAFRNGLDKLIYTMCTLPLSDFAERRQRLT